MLVPITAVFYGWFGEAVILYGLAIVVGVVNVIQLTAPPAQSLAEQIVYNRGPHSVLRPFKT